jgi:hypothetical protein
MVGDDYPKERRLALFEGTILPPYSIPSLLVALCRIVDGLYRHEGLNTLTNRIVSSHIEFTSSLLSSFFLENALLRIHNIYRHFQNDAEKCILHLSAHMTGDGWPSREIVSDLKPDSIQSAIRWLLLGNSCACAVCLNTA